MKATLLLILSFMTINAHAVTIEFPEEELARESVLPIFDNAVAVKSRLVPTAKRFELGMTAGFGMNEPFFNTLRYGGHVGYHFNETHAVMLMGQLYGDGLNTNGQTLSDTVFGGRGERLRMDFAPQTTYHFMANYQITPYYGKISVFKDFVMNLSLYGLLGVGMMDLGGESTPVFNIGMGQKFYITKNWGLRADLGLMAYQGINYFLAKGGGQSPLVDVVADPSDNPTSTFKPGAFEREMNYDLHLSVSLIFLL